LLKLLQRRKERRDFFVFLLKTVFKTVKLLIPETEKSRNQPALRGLSGITSGDLVPSLFR
jgi:hypothetical protein